MEVQIGSKRFTLSEEMRASCGYFQDLQEKKIDLTELFLKENITVCDFEEFVRLLDGRSNCLTHDKLAFFAVYFFCKKAEEYFTLRVPKDMEWKLRFLEKYPTAAFMIPSMAQELLPEVISGRQDMTMVPPAVLKVIKKLGFTMFRKSLQQKFTAEACYIRVRAREDKELGKRKRSMNPANWPPWQEASEAKKAEFEEQARKEIEQVVIGGGGVVVPKSVPKRKRTDYLDDLDDFFDFGETPSLNK